MQVKDSKMAIYFIQSDRKYDCMNIASRCCCYVHNQSTHELMNRARLCAHPHPHISLSVIIHRENDPKYK